MDPRYNKLAETLTQHSISLKKGEKVLIDAYDAPNAMVVALIRAIRNIGGLPFVNIHDAIVQRELLLSGSKEQFDFFADSELYKMEKMDCYIAIRGSHNIFELSDVSSKQMAMYMEAIDDLLKCRVNETKWVILRWPTPGMAQQSIMSTETFEDFYFKVCTLDYSKMVPGMKALSELMDKTDQVHIKGPQTDLKFSIKDIPSIKCGGEFNIPDGEVFTAPVKDSVEGYIHYNAPTVYQGCSFDNVTLEFKKGKIVNAKASSNVQKLNEIFDTDEGARFVGEFAIGFNPYILEPMRDILFDEKIAGSFHFTPGQAYELADNGNRSKVHWDLVSIQRPDYGGGEIYFDGNLIRKDGMFVMESLKQLNPEYLTS